MSTDARMSVLGGGGEQPGDEAAADDFAAQLRSGGPVPEPRTICTQVSPPFSACVGTSRVAMLLS